jgi:uncharacterized protein (DUF2252 family)
MTSATERRLTAHLSLMMALDHVAAMAGACVDQGAVCVWNEVDRTGHPGTNTTWRTELLKDLLQSKGPAPFKRVNLIF